MSLIKTKRKYFRRKRIAQKQRRLYLERSYFTIWVSSSERRFNEFSGRGKSSGEILRDDDGGNRGSRSGADDRNGRCNHNNKLYRDKKKNKNKNKRRNKYILENTERDSYWWRRFIGEIS